MWTRFKAWLSGTPASMPSPTLNTEPTPSTNTGGNTDHDEVLSESESLGDSQGSAPVDPAPHEVNTDLDALGQFQSDLKVALDRDHAELLWWKGQKTEILGTDTQLCQEEEAAGQSELAKPKQSAGAFLKEKLAEIKDMIKMDAEPADWEMEDLFAHFQPHLDALHERMNKLSKQLADHQQAFAKRTPHETRQLAVRLCNAGIEMLDEMTSLHNSFQDEISYCLESEKRAEKGLASFAQFLIYMITKMPAPALEFDFSERYRVSLSNRTEKEKAKLDKFESKIEGGLKKARTAIEKSHQQLKADRGGLKSNPSPLFPRNNSSKSEETATPVLVVANKI